METQSARADAMPNTGHIRRDAFLLKLSQGAALTADDERMICRLIGNTRHYQTGQTIIADGDVPRHLILIQSGWAYRQRYMANGKRQIVSVLLPGDLTEPFGALPPMVMYSLRAVTPVEAGLIDPAQLRAAAEASPSLGQALWQDLLVSAADAHDRVVTLGSLDAVERVGHLFCELHSRLSAIGLVKAGEFEMPMTQADIADLLGLSTVHVNRCMQELRATGMLSLSRGCAKVHDIEALASASMFESRDHYLKPHAEVTLSTGALRR
ncbi:MAG: Crp/Fnr family transcriptional regulator [Devosia sp.]